MNLRQQLAADLGNRIPGCTVPQDRIASLIADGEIRHLTMGERTMREWLVIPNIAAPGNIELLHEAMAYVSSLPKDERRKPAKRSSKKTVKKVTRKVTKSA